MALIPGSIPVTGFIAPTDTTDTYPVTDAIYGIDGLRNVANYTERDNISIERRRAGMVVGTLNDGKYWRLKNQTWTLGDPNDWELFLQVGPSGSLVSTGLKYVVEATDDISVPLYTQYWIYGDLTVYGQLTNYGQVVIADGSLIMSGGTFSNYGALIFTSLNGTTSGTMSYINSSTIAFTFSGSTVSASVITGSLTASHLNSTGGATAGYLLSVNNSGIFEWVPASGVGTITAVNAGTGLTGGGVSGAVTLDVNTTNGIDIVNDAVALGGTLSQNTTIDGGGANTLNITNLDGANNNTVTAGNVTLKLREGNSEFSDYSTTGYLNLLTNYGSIYLNGANDGQANVSLSPTGALSTSFNIHAGPTGNGVSDGSTNNRYIIRDQGSKGLVYYGDYTANFTNNSLVTKQYVDSVIVGAGITAFNGLTETSPNIIALGGSLSQTTIIDTNANTLKIGNGTPGSFTGDGFFLINPNVSMEFDTQGGNFKIFTNGGNLGVTVSGGNINIDNGGGNLNYKGSGDFNIGTNANRVFRTTVWTSNYIDINSSDTVYITATGIDMQSSGTTARLQNWVGDVELDALGGGNVTLYTTGGPNGTIQLLTDVNSIYISTATQAIVNNGVNNTMIVNDYTYNKGLVYNSDYSSNFTPESLVSKRYVDSLINGTPSLSQTLAVNNNTYTYSIVMGTSQSVKSANGGGQINLDYNGVSDHVYITNDNGALTSGVLEVSNHYSGLAAKAYYLGFESYDIAGERSTNIWSTWTSSIVNIGVNKDYYDTYYQYQDIAIHENSTSVSVSDYDRHAIFIGTRNSSFDAGITNSVILGGYGLSATSSNTVYVTNLQLQGNVLGKYTVQPSTQPGFDALTIVTKGYVDSQIALTASKLSVYDKNLTALDTVGNSQFSGATISYTPIDGSYVAVYVNGLEFLVGDGVTSSVDCYFSNDGGVNARGFSSLHPNGRIQANDALYWNGGYSGTNLQSGWRISIHYLI